MGKIRNEDLQLNIYVKSAQGQAELKRHHAAIEQINKDLKENKISNEQAQRAIAQHKSAIQTLTKEHSIQNMTLKELKKNAALARIALQNAAPGSENFKRLQRELAATTARIKELNTGAKATKGIFSGWGAAILASVAIVTRALKGFASRIADFEQANVNLATVLGKPVSEIEALTRSAKDLGATTRYTASEVTGLQTELAKLGFTPEQILSMEKPVLNFATAVGTDLPSAAQLAGAALRIFGLRASDSEEALGVMAVATNKSALNFSYLQSALSTVGPVAKTFGFSLRDTTTLLGALANAGFDASSAATATRNILLNLANSNGKLAKSIGGPVKSFDDLMDAFDKLTSQGIDLAGALELTDRRSVAAFTSFLDGRDAARELHEALGDVSGDLQTIADERMNTLSGSIASLKSAWDGLILSMNNSKGFFKLVVDRLTDTVRLITKITTPKDEKIAGQIDSMATKYQSEGKTNEEIEAEIAALRAERAKYAEVKSATLSDIDEGISLGPGAAVEKAKKSLDERIFILEQVQLKLQELARNGSTTPPPPKSGLDGKGSGGSGGSGGEGGSKTSWSLNSDQSFLEAKAALTKKFNDGEIATQEEYNEQLYQLEVSSLTARLASQKDTAADRAKIEADLQAKIMAHKVAEQKKEKELADAANKIQDELDTYVKKSGQERLYNEDKRWETERKKYEGHAGLLELIDKVHLKKRAKIAIDAENNELADLQKAHDLQKQETENYWLKELETARKGSGDEAALRSAMAVDLANKEVAYLKSLQSRLEDIIKDKQLGGVNLTPEQLQEFQKKLNEALKQLSTAQQVVNNAKAGTWSGSGGGTFLGIAQNDLEILTSSTENAATSAQKLTTAFQLAGGAAQEAFKIAGKAIELAAAKENAEHKKYLKDNEEKKNKLKDRLTAGLLSQTQYDAEVEAIEKDKEAREEELAIKQAKRQKALSLVQAIINTALSISTTLAQFGTTPWGIAAAAVAAAMGAVEVGLIAAQPITGAEEGGVVNVERKQDGKPFKARLNPNKRGYVNGPTVLVGEAGGEYIVPASGLNNPTLAPILGTIESARKAGTLRNLDFSTLYHPSSASGFADGGFSQAIQEAGLMTVSKADLAEIIVWLKSVRAKMNDPVPAQLSYFGRGGLKETMDKYGRARANGVLK